MTDPTGHWPEWLDNTLSSIADIPSTISSSCSDTWNNTVPETIDYLGSDEAQEAYINTGTAYLGGAVFKELRVAKAAGEALIATGGTAATEYYTEKGEPIWPSNSGFAGTPTTTTLQAGTRIDRYGGSTGQYVSPAGTPLQMRSLPAGSESRPYNIYEVAEPLEVQAGEIAPWFNQPGGGIQYKLTQSVKDLVEQGVLTKVGN